MTSHLLVKANYTQRELVNVTPEKAGWVHVGFRAIQLKDQDLENLVTGERELCLVVLTGKVNVTVTGNQFNQTFNQLEILDNTIICPKCASGFMVKRNGKFGCFLGCTNFPKCKETIDLD